MKTLITGATGFIGAAIVRRLIHAGHHVRALIRPDSNLLNLEGLEVELFLGDLKDRASLDRSIRGCESLFHVAADYRLWTPRPEEIYQTNVTGTRNIMRAAAAAGISRIVYTSSVATLGSNRDGSPADEETPVTFSEMIGHYKRSKYLAEEEVRRLSDKEGLPAVIVNPSAPIGPRDIRPTPTGQMILQAASGRMPAYVDTGLNLVHVDDVAEGHLLAFAHGRIGQRYILGAFNMTLKQILAQLSEITGCRSPMFKLPHNLVLPVAFAAEALARLAGGREPFVTVDGVRLAKKRMFFSNKKAVKELGFKARPVIEALRDAVDWFRLNGYLA